jgi:hypothetical protein
MHGPLPCAVDGELERYPHDIATFQTALTLARHALVCSTRSRLLTRARGLGGQAREVKKSAYLNLAAVHLKTDAWREARDACNKARPPRARGAALPTPRPARFPATHADMCHKGSTGGTRLVLGTATLLSSVARPRSLSSTLGCHCTSSACPVACAVQGPRRGQTAGGRGDGVTRAPQVLEKSSGQPKALYRRAQAHMGAGDYVEAEVDIKAALQVRGGANRLWWIATRTHGGPGRPAPAGGPCRRGPPALSAA